MKIRIKVPAAARKEWDALLASLPGRRREDVMLLVEQDLMICAKDIVAIAAKQHRSPFRWTCPFAPKYELLWASGNILRRFKSRFLEWNR